MARQLENLNDIVGQTFSELTVQEYAGRINGRHKYKCLCSCGNECMVERYNLMHGATRSCGHLHSIQKKPDYDVNDIVGRKFGKWKVLKSAGKYNANQQAFLCRCECGNESILPRQSLTRGLSTSCGHCRKPWIEKENDYCRYYCGDGKSFIFSPEDSDLVSSRQWCVSATGYVEDIVAHEKLARLIMDASGDEYVDHVSMDTTDDRRENLRVCSWSDNNCNKILQTNNKSGFKGVSFHKASGKFLASLWKDGAHHYGGLHATAEEAALAYDELAREYHGEYARLNFPQKGERGCRVAV